MSLAYGTGMTNTDMVFFPGSSSDLKDLYSSGYRRPSEDSTNNYVDTEKTSGDGVHTYVTFRDMDTSDTEDFVFECGKTHSFSWVGHSDNSGLVKHNKDGDFQIELADDCSSVATGSAVSRSL